MSYLLSHGFLHTVNCGHLAFHRLPPYKCVWILLQVLPATLKLNPGSGLQWKGSPQGFSLIQFLLPMQHEAHPELSWLIGVDHNSDLLRRAARRLEKASATVGTPVSDMPLLTSGSTTQKPVALAGAKCLPTIELLLASITEEAALCPGVGGRPCLCRSMSKSCLWSLTQVGDGVLCPRHLGSCKCRQALYGNQCSNHAYVKCAEGGGAKLAKPSKGIAFKLA